MSSAVNIQLSRAQWSDGRSLRKRLCSYVAQWFTVTQFIVKVLELLLGVTTIVMVLEWQSHGLTVMDLTQGSFSYRDRFICFIAVACISSLYCTVMVAMGLGGLNIPPNLRVLMAGGVLLLWLLGSAIASAALEELNMSLLARTEGLNTLLLEIATALGFISMVVLLFDVLLAFLALRAFSDSREFGLETEKSKSALYAVKSGRSLVGHSSTQMSRTASYRSQQISHEDADDLVSEVSPLRSYEATEPHYT